MRKDGFSVAADEITAALNELKEINKQISDLSEGELSMRAKAKTDELRNEIKDYLSLRGSLLLKVAKLKSDYFVVKNGRLVGRDRSLKIEPNARNAEKMISEAKATADSCLKSVCSGIITASVEAGISSSVQTLYVVFDSAEKLRSEFFALEKARAEKLSAELHAKKAEIENRLEAMKKDGETLRKLSEEAYKKAFLTDREPQKELTVGIELPVALKTSAGVHEFLYWNVSTDGPLVVNFDGDLDKTADFVRAVTLNFLYSYPGANKKILYATGNDSDDINNFLRLLFENVGKEIFYAEKTTFRHPLGDFGSYEFMYSLRELIESRSTLLEKYGYKNIFEYNAANAETVKPPVLAFLQGYPCGFKKSDALEYFFKNGAKTGVFFVVIKTNKKSDEYARELPADPEPYSNFVLKANDNFDFIYDGETYESLKIDSAAARKAEKLISDDIEASRSVLGYESIGFGKYSAKTDDNANVLSIPVGKADGKTYELKFAISSSGSEPISYLVIGTQGMGKSSLIDAMLLNGGMKYSPDDLQFWLIDFKDGVSSSAYADHCAMPHIRLLAQSSRLEDALIILTNLKEESERRNEIFTKFNVKDLASYNKLSEKHMPHIVVVIDEVHNVFADSVDAGRRKAAAAISGLLDKFVREGRSEGIHFLIASQTVSMQMMKSVGELIDGRICFSARSQSDAECLVGREGASVVVNECNRAGYAVVKNARDTIFDKICVAYHCSKEAGYAAAVREKWSKYPVSPIIVGDKSPLYAVDFVGDAFETGGRIPIGESFYDHSAYGVTFGDGRRSLMAIGEIKDGDTAQDDLVTSLVIGAARAGIEIELLDATKNRRVGELFDECGVANVYDERDYLKVLSSAVQTLKKRNSDARSRYKPILYVFHGLSRVGEFLANSGEKSNPTEQVDGMPEGYRSLSSVSRRQTSSVRGADGISYLIEKNTYDVDFFVVATFSSVSSVEEIKYSFRKADYMIFTPTFVSETEKIVGDAYSQSQGMSCGKNLLLVSEKGRESEKVRFFRYSDDRETFEYIKKAVKR